MVDHRYTLRDPFREEGLSLRQELHQTRVVGSSYAVVRVVSHRIGALMANEQRRRLKQQEALELILRREREAGCEEGGWVLLWSTGDELCFVDLGSMHNQAVVIRRTGEVVFHSSSDR